MMQYDSDNSRCTKGVTLVELVVAVSMMTIILTAVLPLFASIRSSWDTKRANTEILQNTRVLIDHLQRNLGPAVQIAGVSPFSQNKGYIEFTAHDGIDYRYSVVSDGYVRFGPSSGKLADLAGPVSQFRFACFDGNDFATPTDDPASIRFVTTEMAFPNSASLGREKLFTTSVYLRSSANTSLFEPGVAIRDLIAWGGNGTNIDSYRSSQGPYNPAKPGMEAVVSVNAIGYGKITLWTQTSIRGDAYIGPGGDPDLGIKTWGGSEITGARGTLTSAVDMAKASPPSGPPFDGHHEGTLKLWGARIETLDSDRYFNKVQLLGNSKLIIDGHVTLLLNNAFQMGDWAEISVLPDSSLTVYVKNNFTVGDSAKLNDSTKDPSRLHIYMIGNNKGMDMGSNAMVHAVVENPNGRVTIWNSAQFFGKIKAAQLLGGGRIHVDLDCGFDSDNG